MTSGHDLLEYDSVQDLEDTIESNQTSLEEEEKHIKKLQEEIYNLDNEINETYAPKLDEIKTNISKLSENLSISSKLEIYNKELQYYLNKKADLETKLKVKPAEPSSSLIEDKNINPLLKYIKEFLHAWNYPGGGELSFDPSIDNFDIVIFGKNRKSFGKGLRAISYSSVLLGLLRYCIEQDRPFSNLLVLDSPLTTYRGRQPIEGEEISKDIQSSFFENMAKLKADCQVIVFDNKIPKEKVISKINYEYFTRTSEGRYGFFPINTKDQIDYP